MLGRAQILAVLVLCVSVLAIALLWGSAPSLSSKHALVFTDDGLVPRDVTISATAPALHRSHQEGTAESATGTPLQRVGSEKKKELLEQQSARVEDEVSTIAAADEVQNSAVAVSHSKGTSTDSGAWKQRLAPHPTLAPLFRRMYDTRGGSGGVARRPASLGAPDEGAWMLTGKFETEYKKVTCGALVRNFCMKDGQPRYFTADGQKLLTRSGATTLCNEAVVKQKLHMVVHQATNAGLPPRYTEKLSLEFGTLLVVPFCWELYGYHLLLCLTAMHTHLQRLGVPELVAEQNLTVRVVMMKGSGLFPYLRGSAHSWSDPEPPAQLPSKAKPTPYWPLWALLADRPEDVETLADFGARDKGTQCFGVGVFGSPPSPKVTPAEGRATRAALIDRLKVQPRREQPLCRRYRVTLLQRAKQYRITNIDDVEAALRKAFGDTLEVLRTVQLEGMSMAAQLELAANTDVLVGVHGNGLSWSALMPDKGALIELWPRAQYNANYVVFAQRANLKYAAVKGDGTCKARCMAAYDVSAAAKAAVAHLADVACQGKPFTFNSTFAAGAKR